MTNGRLEWAFDSDAACPGAGVAVGRSIPPGPEVDWGGLGVNWGGLGVNMGGGGVGGGLARRDWGGLERSGAGWGRAGAACGGLCFHIGALLGGSPRGLSSGALIGGSHRGLSSRALLGGSHRVPSSRARTSSAGSTSGSSIGSNRTASASASAPLSALEVRSPGGLEKKPSHRFAACRTCLPERCAASILGGLMKVLTADLGLDRASAG